MNPYFTERVVAFIDILGFKEKVCCSINNADCADKLHSSLQYILSLKEENENTATVMSLKKLGLEITTFSDSIVMSYPVEYQGALFTLLLDVIHLQLVLACKGILIRGGISIGSLFHDGNIVYGPAMNEAYELESVYAKMPRVIIAKETIQQGIEKTKLSHNSLQEETEYVLKLITEDDDGWLFVDILRQNSELTDEGSEYFYWLSILRNSIVENLNLYKDDVKIMEKYIWLKDYFNTVVRDKNAFYPVPESFNIDEQRQFRCSYDDLAIIEQLDGTFG